MSRNLEYIYFKRKNGSVFGKVNSITKGQTDSYIKDDCVSCDKNGKELESPKGTKKK